MKGTSVEIVRRIVPVVVIVALLSGCTPEPAGPAAAPSAPVFESSTPTPTPTPTQAEASETGLTQPGQVFGGTCDALLSEADASELLGTKVALAETNPIDVFETALVWQPGGIRCNWIDKTSTVALSLSAAPSYAVGELDAPEACKPNRHDINGDISCGIVSEQNGIVVSGLAGLGGGTSTASKKKAEKIVASLTEAIETTSTSEMAKPVTLPAPGAWANPGVAPDKNPPTCADIDRAIVASDFMGGGTRGTPEEVFPVTGYLSPIDQELAGSVSNEPSWCSWSAKRTTAEIDNGQISQLFSRELGGGAWILDHVAAAPGAKKITIDGVDRAFRYTSKDGQKSIWVADGPNAASFTYFVGQKDAGYRSVALVVEALNALNVG